MKLNSALAIYFFATLLFYSGIFFLSFADIITSTCFVSMFTVHVFQLLIRTFTFIISFFVTSFTDINRMIFCDCLVPNFIGGIIDVSIIRKHWLSNYVFSQQNSGSLITVRFAVQVIILYVLISGGCSVHQTGHLRGVK